MNFFMFFLSGLLLCNGLPHLISGLQGRPFPTPFAKPPGRGKSSPVVNFLWGTLNIFASIVILSWRITGSAPGWTGLAMAVGFVAMGVMLSRHFGKV